MTVIRLLNDGEPKGAPMIDARVLHYFLRVVELGSISRASQDAGISQPSLSRAIHLLEKQIGEPLLVRSPRGVQVTHAGDMLVERARSIVSQLEAMTSEISGTANARIAIGMPISMWKLVTLPFIRSFAAANPDTKLRLFEGINNNLRGWMEDGLVDIAVVVGLEDIPPTFEPQPLVVESLNLVGREFAAFENKAYVTLADLGALNMISPGRPNPIRAFVEHSMQRAGQVFRCTIEAETISACLDLCREGAGYCIVPSCAVASEMDLKVMPLAESTISWNLCINRARRHSRPVQTAVRELKNLVVAQVTDGNWPGAQTITSSR
jgi:LysR family nitrogen assimilation transcriptional regulator